MVVVMRFLPGVLFFVCNGEIRLPERQRSNTGNASENFCSPLDIWPEKCPENRLRDVYGNVCHPPLTLRVLWTENECTLVPYRPYDTITTTCVYWKSVR